MEFETIIEPLDAANCLGRDDWVFVDCRFSLGEPGRGEREFGESHIAGALYAHLDRDLSGPVIPGTTGRHPLPSPRSLERTLGRLGIGNATQVVAYDESTGAMTAARLWWLLKWAGHDAVAVLNGGLRRWQSLGLPCAGGAESRRGAEFVGSFRANMIFDAAHVKAILEDPLYIILDARGADRYQGLNETIDPVAGHIPGAVSAPYMDNLSRDGVFKPRHEVARRFEMLAGGRDPGHVVFYCGSGVTAAHDVLAFVYAGKGTPALYPGSWSEWITDPSRPVAAGG